jgi:hypothetical protein
VTGFYSVSSGKMAEEGEKHKVEAGLGEGTDFAGTEESTLFGKS